MTLFEITTGWTGESYVRAYAWAESEEQAITLFRASNDQKYDAPVAKALFSKETAPFCTKASDYGWEV